jgi:hypothetical protein
MYITFFHAPTRPVHLIHILFNRPNNTKSFFSLLFVQSRCSSVRKVTGYELDDRGSVPATGRNFSLRYHVKMGYLANLASYPVVTGGLFPRR